MTINASSTPRYNPFAVRLNRKNKPGAFPVNGNPGQTPGGQTLRFGKKYDWVVIGNGPHGNILATTMLEKGVPKDKLVMVDPLDPLELWTKTNTNAGWSRNAEEVSRETDLSHQTEQYAKLHRIPFPITNSKLNDFLERLRAKIGHMKIPHLKAQATTITKPGDYYNVHLRDGSPIKAKNVVLAIGNYTEPVWPEWARNFKQTHSGANMHHVFDMDFDLGEFKKDWKDVVIVGGGPAALNLALILSQEKPGHVTLLVRNPIRGTGVSLVDPCHLPEGFEDNHCYQTFKQLDSCTARREYITKHRPIGAVGKSIDFMAAMDYALEHNMLKVVYGEAESASLTDEGIHLKLKKTTPTPVTDKPMFHVSPTGKVTLDTSIDDFDKPIETEEPTFTSDGKLVMHEPRMLSATPTPPSLTASSVLLATGFKNMRPGGEFINNVIRDLNLKVHSEDGFPSVDEHLRWRDQPGLFVMGRLADHELGPYAWNVAGGILATKRIIESEQARETFPSVGLSHSLSHSPPPVRLSPFALLHQRFNPSRVLQQSVAVSGGDHDALVVAPTQMVATQPLSTGHESTTGTEPKSKKDDSLLFSGVA